MGFVKSLEEVAKRHLDYAELLEKRISCSHNLDRPKSLHSLFYQR